MRGIGARNAAGAVRWLTAAIVISILVAEAIAPRSGWTATPISFLPPILINQPVPGTLIAADFNGDGNLDLAVVGKGITSILYGIGDGQFGLRDDVALPITNGPMQAVVADVNGDGLPDLLIAYGGDGQARGKIAVAINLGHHVFAAPVTYTGYIEPSRLTAVDLNDDGKADLVVL